MNFINYCYIEVPLYQRILQTLQGLGDDI